MNYIVLLHRVTIKVKEFLK
jgi:hypothetical protein